MRHTLFSLSIFLNLVMSRRKHYREGLRVRDEKLLMAMIRLTSIGLPLVYVAFVVVYFVVGFTHYNVDKF